MPRNYSLVAGADFQPFTFEDYARPYMMYREAYKEAEDKYAELEELSSIWDMRLDNAGDEGLKERFNTFKGELEKQAGIIASEGLNPSTKRMLSKLRGQYLGTFAPIEEAYNINK